MKFKVGDKVKCIAGTYTGPRSGQTYEISEVDSDGSKVDVKELPNQKGWYANRFELVESTVDPLQKLLDEANTGIKALVKLQQNHQQEVQTYNINNKCMAFGPKFDDHYSANIFKAMGNFAAGYLDGVFELRKVEKPKFKPINTLHGKAEVVDGQLQVGCQKVPIDFAKTAIKWLLDDGDSFTQGTHTATPSYKGIRYKNYCLPWGDAKNIYEQLKDM